MTKIMKHCGYSNTLNIGYLNFQMKFKISGQRNSQGILLTSNRDGRLGSMKASKIQHAKYEVVHTGSRLRIVTLSMLARVPLFSTEKRVWLSPTIF